MTKPVTPRFAPGMRVRVIIATPPHHYRTPSYVQGKVGYVEVLYGLFRNPESLAYGKDGLPQIPLYQVLFLQTDVWKERYAGPSHDTISVDLYDHWLEKA